MSATLSWNLVFLTPHARAALCGPGKSLLLRNARARARVSGFKVRSSYQQLPSELGERFVSNLQGLIYTVADAAVSSSASSTDQVVQAQKGDWLSGLTNALETVLKVLKDILEALHVPYSYGFAIILLTVLVKGATFPLTKKQVESTMAMQNLQPKLKEIQQRYAGNQEMIQQETARLYQRAGVNPLAGCLPTLATIPVWIGLYRALSNVANEGLLTEGFFWIPSLAGPTTIAARQNGSGISWLFPFLDGHPPLGWSDTLAYLVLPMLLIMSQYVSMQIMQPPQANDPSQKQSQAILKFLPLMIGYFALSVPSGLSLYWLTNNILSTTQQLWFRKHRNVKPPPLQNLESTKNIIDIQANLPVSPKPKTDVKEPRRGERFKQIMAEEARRKKEREAAATQKIGEQSPMVGNRTDPDHSKNTESGSQSSEANSMGVNGYQHNTVAENKNKIITDSNRQNSETSDEAGPSNHTVESSDLSARK